MRRSGRRGVVEEGEEVVAPGGAGVADVPRVKAVGRKDERVSAGECGDVGPVGFVSAVDDGTAERKGGEVGEDAGAVRREPRVLQVVMHVEERRRHARAAAGAVRSVAEQRRGGARGRKCG